MSSRILLVEDEENLQRTIKLNLELEGFQVTACGNGREAISLFRSAWYDLVILDVMLPEVDGFTICQTIRLENANVPVLFLTAKGAGEDRVKGLRSGGDDYLTKPFNLEEFLLRVQNLLKRTRRGNDVRKPASETVSFGENRVDFTTYEISGENGKTQTLGKREILLLKLLIEREGEVVSREEILRTVWGVDVYPTTRTIDNYILSFRKYFEKNPKEPKHFHSVRGVGYKFTSS
jgi:two-component system, OmpR family, alkaline phosphatase synthesis response regulator PhoP